MELKISASIWSMKVLCAQVTWKATVLCFQTISFFVVFNCELEALKHYNVKF